MSNYSAIRKLDEESLRQLTEGKGPSDKCICSLIAPPVGKRGFGASIKKALASMGPSKRRNQQLGGFSGRNIGARSIGKGKYVGQNQVDIPLTFTRGGKGIYTTKEVIKRTSACGKCGCDNDKVVLKHSFANIRITSPDVSSICPCPTDCMPGKEKLQNNIKVTVERLQMMGLDSEDSEAGISNDCNVPNRSVSEGRLGLKRKCVTSLVDAVYEDIKNKSEVLNWEK